MPSGPLGGPRPFSSDDCFPAEHRRFPESAVDYSEKTEVQKFANKWAYRDAYDPQDEESIVQAYMLQKPMTQLSIYGFEPEEKTADTFEERIGRWFYTYRFSNTYTTGESPYYYNDILIISRFEGLVELIEHNTISHATRGLLLGYAPHNVAGFIQDIKGERFK